MKKLLIIPLLLISMICSSATYYVAKTGSDSNAGTLASPFATWAKGVSMLSSPGDILYIRGGTYNVNGGSSKVNGTYNGVFISGKKGTSSSPIQILAYNNEVVIVDGSAMTQQDWKAGITLVGCSYMKIKGIILQNVLESKAGTGSAESFYGENCNNITLENCTVTKCGNGFRLAGNCDYIYYINCDAYNCWDIGGTTTSGGPGGYCNGFNGNYQAGKHNFLVGCRAWLITDDGYDNMAGGGYITYTNCWAFQNGHTSVNSIVGDGDGFKLGFSDKGSESGVQRILHNCVSVSNDAIGFDESMDIGTTMKMELYNCAAYNNIKNAGFRFAQTAGSSTTTLKNNISFSNAPNRNYEGRSRNVTDHNSWDAGAPAVTAADFLSMDATELSRPRKSDGSLPDLNMLHLVSGSGLIDKGIDIGTAFTGSAPDLGAFESQSSKSAAPVALPTYTSSVIENAAPSVLSVTYNLALANVIPAASAFAIKVNSAARSVKSMTISGAKVLITLASPVVNGDVITVAYTKPATNPLQTSTGGQAATIAAQKAVNNVAPASKTVTQSTIKMTIFPNPVHMIINILLQSASTAVSQQTIKIFDISGKLCLQRFLDTGTTKVQIPINFKSGIYIVQVFSGSLIMASQKIIVY